MPEHAYYVYILASTYKRLYIGVTSNLEHRIAIHKSGQNNHAFTTRYKIDQLVYIEHFQYIQTAIARETHSKAGYARERSPSSSPQTQPGETSAWTGAHPPPTPNPQPLYSKALPKLSEKQPLALPLSF